MTRKRFLRRTKRATGLVLGIVALILVTAPDVTLAADPPAFDVPPTPPFNATLTVDVGQLLEFPVQASDADVQAGVTQIAAGFDHTCALLDTGAVRCWGFGAEGRLGYGDTLNIGENETPASTGDVDVGGTVVQIAAGGYHTCALLDTGAVRCWGRGINGQLGYGNTDDIGDNETPASAGNVEVVDPGDVVTLGVVGLPAGADFAPGAPANPVSATFTWVPTAHDVGGHAVTFTAEDGTGLTATPHTINVTVAGPPPLPIRSVGTWGLAIMATAFAVVVVWRSRRRAMRA